MGAGEGVVERVGPEPLDLPAYLLFGGHRVLRAFRFGKIGDVVNPVADLDAPLGGGVVQLAHVHHHGPALGSQGFGKTLEGRLHLAGAQQLPGRFAAQPEKSRKSSNFDEFSSVDTHHFTSACAIFSFCAGSWRWQPQQFGATAM